MAHDGGSGASRPVIYLLPYLGLGGTEYHVLYLVQAIAWSSPPAVVAPDGALRAPLEQAGARVFNFRDLTGRWWEAAGSFRQALHRAVEAVAPAVRAAGGRVVLHVHGSAELLLLARWWLRGTGHAARFLFTSHGYFGPGAAASYRLAATLLGRTRTPVIAVSRQEAERLVRAGLPREQVCVIPNGVPDPLEQPAEPWPFGPGSPRVLSVGRLVEQKGMRQLLEAFERALPSAPQARLVIVGSGPLEQQLRRRVEGSPLLGRSVELPGPRERASRWLRHADVFCLASLDEALPLSLIEAMGSGCAVVSTTAGGIPELLEDGRSGLLVPPGDVQALAAALRQVLTDPPLRERLGREGRRRFQERFTARAMAQRTLAVYDRLHQQLPDS